MSDTATSTGTNTDTMPRLKVRYNDEVRAQLQEQLSITNVMEVPNFDKIVINMGVGRAAGQPSLLEGAVADLTVTHVFCGRAGQSRPSMSTAMVCS